MLTLPTQLLLAGLIVLSAALFAHGLVWKLRGLRGGPPERPRTDHVARRLARSAKEVFLHTRVARGRPVTAALHAVVFFGFVLFLPETIEHFCRGLGFSVLEPALGPALRIYRAAMVAIASGVALAITGLAFRRFALVRISPDPRSKTSAIIAAFIFVLMLTYLNGMAERPIAPAVNWWTHALVILAFPIVIVRSKHLHLLLAPFTIFLRNERLGDYLPLDLEALADESSGATTIGFETLADVPWKLRLDFLTCVECRRCTDNCPSALSQNEGDPRGFILAGRRAIAAGPPDSPVLGPIISESALASCVTCGMCEAECPVGVEHLQLILGARRAQTLASGVGVIAGEFFRAVESFGNPFSQPKSARRELITELGLPRFTGAEGEWLWWLGCVWGYNQDQRQAVAALKRVLDAGGVRYGVLEEEPCCGHHSRRQGEEAQFQELARASVAALAQNRAARIVTSCPHCLHTLRHEHAPFDGVLSLTVLHHSELISQLLASGALRVNAGALAGKRAAYHDPCYLARYEHVTAAPRSAARAVGATLIEPRHHGDRTLCCGGGATGFLIERKGKPRIDQPRRTELLATGADLLITSCPECRMMVDAVLPQTLDVAEVIAGALPAAPAADRAPDRAGAVAPSAAQQGGPMPVLSTCEQEMERCIRSLFASRADSEMQLLDIAAIAHLSGKLAELRHAADHLVAAGELAVECRQGVHYYRLAAATTESEIAPH